MLKTQLASLVSVLFLFGNLNVILSQNANILDGQFGPIRNPVVASCGDEDIKMMLQNIAKDILEIKTEIKELRTETNGRLNELNITILEANNNKNDCQKDASQFQVNPSAQLNLKPKHTIPASCKVIKNVIVNSKSGVYWIQPNDAEDDAIEAYCDMDDDGGGWTVIQRREAKNIQSESKYKNWNEFENGFGNKNGDYWIGLKHMHSLTQNCEHEVKVTLVKWCNTPVSAKYSNFKVAGKENDFRLTLGSYLGGTLEDGMSNDNNQKFTTVDKDNDGRGGENCAVSRKGAGWHGPSCTWVNLNGGYGSGRIYWANGSYSYKQSEMKIRSKCLN